MPVYEIYTYGGGAYLAELFTSLGLLLGSDNFNTLVRIAGLLGILWIALETLGRRLNTQIDLMYFIRFAMIYMALLVPKVDVAIVDRINPPTAGPVVINNVPLGLGIFAHITSTLGDGLTRMYETNISVPGDLKYEQNGMLLGSALIQSGYDLQFPDADFAHDMNAWLEQCGFWQITRGLVSEDDLAKSEDIWGLLKASASTLRYVELSQVNAATGDNFWTCRDAVVNLDGRWNAQIDGAATLWGVAAWPQKTTADAKAAVLATASGAYGYLGASSRSSSELIQQHVMITATKQALLNFASSSDATAAAVNIAQAQAEASQRTTYQVMGNMAAKLLPTMHVVLEAVIYGLFPIVAFFMLLPSGGIALLFYIKVLVWLQLWAPTYAIINSLMTWYGQYQNGAVSLLDTAMGNHGIALETAQGLFSANADLLAMAGYMAISIPMIAWMLVQAGAVAGTAVASHLASPAQSAAQTAATGAASGNISLGSLSTDNVARNNWNANKHDSNLEMKGGGLATQTASGAMVRGFGHGSGGALYDAGHSLPSPGASANVTGAIGAAYSQASRQQNAAAESATLSSSRALASAIDQYAAYDRSHGTSATARTGASAGAEGSVGTGGGEMAKFMDGWNDGNKYSSGQKAQIMTTAAAGLGVGALKLSGKFDGASDAQLQRSLDSSKQYMQENNWQEKFDAMKKGATSETYERADAGGRTALDGVRSSLQTADRFAMEGNLARSRGAAFEQAASEVRNSAMETGTSFNRTMMTDLAAAGVSAAQWDRLGDGERNALVGAWAQDYAAAHANEVLHRHGITPPDPGAAGDFHAVAAQDPAYGQQGVMDQNRVNHGEVEGRQQAAGVKPGAMPEDRVTAKAQALQHDAQGQIDGIHAGISDRGAAVSGQAEDKTRDGGSLAADALAGGATQVLNFDTPLGNPGKKLQAVVSSLGIGAAPGSEHGASGRWSNEPAPNSAPAGWDTDKGRGGTGW